MIKRFVIAPLFALGLAACETMPAPYAPMSGPSGTGYSELRLEQNRYRVTYRGAARQGQAQVEDLALLRAAELALGQGYDWFRVVDRYAEARGGGGPTFSVGAGNTSFGRSSAVGVGLGTSFNLGGGGTRAVTLEVQMGRGARPTERDVYGAADVAQSIRARL